MLDIIEEQFSRLDKMRDIGVEVLIQQANSENNTNISLCNFTDIDKKLKQLSKEAIEKKQINKGTFIISFDEGHYTTFHFVINEQGLVSILSLDAIGECRANALYIKLQSSLGPILKDLFIVKSSGGIQKGLGCMLFAIEHAIECWKIDMIDLVEIFKAQNLGHSIQDVFYIIPWEILPSQFLQYTQSQRLWIYFKEENEKREGFLRYNYHLIDEERNRNLEKAQALTLANGGTEKIPGFNGDPIPALFDILKKKRLFF